MQAQINHHQPPLGASTNHQHQYQIQIGKKENKKPSLPLPPIGHLQHRNPPPTPYPAAKLKTNPSKTIPSHQNHTHTQPPQQTIDHPTPYPTTKSKQNPKLNPPTNSKPNPLPTTHLSIFERCGLKDIRNMRKSVEGKRETHSNPD